jgi:LmbE family N-acetylglucosaminyl deacetylase
MTMKKFMTRLLNRLRVGSGDRDARRFVIGRWADVDDPELAAAVLAAGCFQRRLDPVALPVETLDRIVVLAPHQDDETIGAGGALLLARAAGVPVDVVFVTDGGSKGATAYGDSPEDVVEIRNREAQQVCDRLGATVHHLGIANGRPAPTLEDLDRLSDLLERLQPATVLLPWILDAPPRHRMVHHLLWLAHQRRALPDFEVWGFQVHNELLPNGYVDITTVAEEKRSLLACYRSQNEHIRRYDHLAMGLAAWNSRHVRDGGEARFLEVFFTLPVAEHLRLVEQFYFRSFTQTYRSVDAVAHPMEALHRAVVGDVDPGA